MEQKICDYSNYDYKESFWNQNNRQYEHKLETSFLTDIFNRHVRKKTSIIDAGCGFGRLFRTYSTFFKTYTLIDYAQNLLDQAKEDLKNISNITYKKASLYDFTVEQPADVILSIRTLHHLSDTKTLFQQFHKALPKDGLLILDIPNKQHLKNRIKYIFDSTVIYDSTPLKLNDCFYNYLPSAIFNDLEESGFDIVDKYQVGLFRIPIIKKICPTQILIFMEKYINKLCRQFNYAPSIYIIAKKCG